jgi:hypothetical protein
MAGPFGRSVRLPIYGMRRPVESPTPHYHQTFGAQRLKNTRLVRRKHNAHAAAECNSVICCLRGQYNS